MKIKILVDPETIESYLGLPFTWVTPATLGGVLLLSAVITMGFPRTEWRRAYVALLTGAVLSLVGDWLRAFPDGHSDPWLYPFLLTYRPPTPGLYVTSDPLVLGVVIAVTTCVLLLDRYRF
ncbi:hypothetical protein VB779_16500 [Haloarculaceae archaeon H-GB11]|nr:hypothetical protein [Haloarculaceae archaeon H-GB11]